MVVDFQDIYKLYLYFYINLYIILIYLLLIYLLLIIF